MLGESFFMGSEVPRVGPIQHEELKKNGNCCFLKEIHEENLKYSHLSPVQKEHYEHGGCDFQAQITCLHIHPPIGWELWPPAWWCIEDIEGERGLLAPVVDPTFPPLGFWRKGTSETSTGRKEEDPDVVSVEKRHFISTLQKLAAALRYQRWVVTMMMMKEEKRLPRVSVIRRTAVADYHQVQTPIFQNNNQWMYVFKESRKTCQWIKAYKLHYFLHWKV